MYAIASCNLHFWDNILAESPLSKLLRLSKKEDLNLGNLEANNVKTIFFPHWSWIVPESILNTYECICFHSAPVPYGRGGSPIQNMIIEGFKETEVVALRMVKEMDAGPVYLRKKISLIGGGEEIMLRVYNTISDMIKEFLESKIEPIAQTGDVYSFARRKPFQSELNGLEGIEKWFDKIRMLDIEGYPTAYIKVGNKKITFSRPSMRFGNKIEATVEISEESRSNEG